MPLVSVAMASYNYEKFLPEAIEGVLNQGCKDIELIIVDDSSKDSSPQIIKSYQEKDKRVRSIFHSENKGIARTFNDGIDQATGKFMATMGSDDVWVEDKLEKQLEVLKGNENLVVYSDSMIIDAQSNLVAEPVGKKLNATKKKRKKNGNIFRELLGSNFVCGSSIIFKKDNIRNIRYDEQLKYTNDYKFTLDLAKKYEFHFIPEALVKYRVHGGNITLRDKGGWLKDFALFGKELLEKYEDEFSSRAKARWLFKIASDAQCRGDFIDARKYILKAIKTRPLMARYWKLLISSFGKNLIPAEEKLNG